MFSESYNWTELELVPYTGPIDPVGGKEEVPGEESEAEYWTGGDFGEPGWIPPKVREEEESKRGREKDVEQEYLDSMRRKAAEFGVAGPKTYEEAKEFEMFLPRLERKAELEELERQARIEEARTRMAALKAARPSKLQRFLRGTGRTWKGIKEVAGPRKPVKGLYIPRVQPELYVPRVPRWRPTTEFMPAGEAHRPHLEELRRVGTPPPSTKIKVPFRDVERFEGLGTAMGRLRKLEEFPNVDWAVYQEIHANGDIDTPSHIRKEVGQLGFSRKEIDASLTRLRKLGLIVPTGMEVNGEKELMVVGG